MPAYDRSHYSGDYKRRRDLLRLLASGDPTTRCWRCGRTLAEHKPHRNGDPATWHAGHVDRKRHPRLLAPEASTCNLSAGATAGNRERNEPHSQDVV